MGFLLLGAVRPSLSPSWSYPSSMVSLPVLPQWDPRTPGPPTRTISHPPRIACPPLCLQQGLWFIFQPVLTTDCDWHLTDTPNSHLNAQMIEYKSPFVSSSEQQWPLHSSVLAHHHHHHPDGHCCLHPPPLSKLLLLSLVAS